MKTIKKNSTWFDNILNVVWSLTMIIGCSYLVFFVGISAWWFLLAVPLATADVYSHKEEIED